MKTATPTLTLLLALLPLGACTGSDNQAETANTSTPGDSTGPANTDSAEVETPDFKARCVQLFVRQRSCTDDFIPALVDARIRLDKPAGITDRATTEGRDALVAEALQEWADDSKDAAIDSTCENIAASMPAEARAPMLTAVGSCLEKSDCSAFAACIVPVIEEQH